MSTVVDEWMARLVVYNEPRGILRFVDEQFGVELDPWQERALLLYESKQRDDQRISLQACAGPGKSAVLAWCIWYFLACKGTRGEHPKGIATSINADNLRDNLWAECAKWQGASEYLTSQFTWTSKRIHANDHPETWFVAARTWPKTATADEQGKTFSGMHSMNVSAFVDESGAIPTTVLRAAEQALSRCEFGKIIQAGNPISLEGMLYAAANELANLWRVLRITGDPDDPEAWVHSERVGAGPLLWAKQQIAQYGRDNPWVKSYILGQFPPASINALLGIEDVLAAMKRRLRSHEYDWAQKRLGVDVARFGDDRSIIIPRQGMQVFKPAPALRNVRTTVIAARVAAIADRWQGDGEGQVVVFVDDTGHWGHGVIDALMTTQRTAYGVVFSDKAGDPRYFNRRAEMYMQMAEAIKHGGLALPNIPELVGELTAPTYTFHKGAFLIEEKDQIKKKLGRSPDIADALALTFAMPDQPMESKHGAYIAKQRAGKARTHDDDE